MILRRGLFSKLVGRNGRRARRAGLTVVELLLVLGILSILGLFLSRDVSQVLSQSYFTNSVERIVHTLRTAQVYSIGGKEGSSWGLHLEAGKITLFKGTDWASRDSGFDVSSDLPASLLVTGWRDFYFDKLRGTPSEAFSFLVEYQKRVGTISVGSQGAINRP
uniref:Prepilin-type N-terminal cleavage/methylation domain-containing protein n=1 Tax=candidate division WWE3 bacterium TaxID=2053526 RepID=A0A831Z127_UNCKA